MRKRLVLLGWFVAVFSTAVGQSDFDDDPVPTGPYVRFCIVNDGMTDSPYGTDSLFLRHFIRQIPPRNGRPARRYISAREWLWFTHPDSALAFARAYPYSIDEVFFRRDTLFALDSLIGLLPRLQAFVYDNVGMHRDISLMFSLDQRFYILLWGREAQPIDYVNHRIFQLPQLHRLKARHLSCPLFSADTIQLPSLNYFFASHIPDTTFPYGFENSDTIVEFAIDSSALREISTCIFKGNFIESVFLGNCPITRIRQDCQLNRITPIFISINQAGLSREDVNMIKSMTDILPSFISPDTVLDQDVNWERYGNDPNDGFGFGDD